MRKFSFKRLGLVLGICVLALVPITGAHAALIFTDTYGWTDGASGGSISVTVDVFDNFAGDFSKYEWNYTIANIDYDPIPGTTNGLSGFNLDFADTVPELADQFGPAGWFMNCCGTPPPSGAEWDIDNAGGLGIMPGTSDVFGFSTGARTVAITNASWMHSWDGFQVNIFSDFIAVPGAPVPEPASAALLSLGLAGIAYRRRKRA